MLKYELNQYLWPKINAILLCIYQNTEEEEELLIACEDGDLETVKRLSSVITVREVRDYLFKGSDYLFKGSPLHNAARYVNLLFRTKLFILCLTHYNVTLYL